MSSIWLHRGESRGRKTEEILWSSSFGLARVESEFYFVDWFSFAWHRAGTVQIQSGVTEKAD